MLELSAVTSADDKKRIGARLKAFRAAAGLHQDEAAVLSGVPIGTLQNWERGKAVPNMQKIQPLADVYGCTTADLAGGVAAHSKSRLVRVPFRLVIHPRAGVSDAMRQRLESFVSGQLDAHLYRVAHLPEDAKDDARPAPPPPKPRRRTARVR